MRRREVIATAVVALTGCTTQTEVENAMNEIDLENTTKLNDGERHTDLYRMEDPEAGVVLYADLHGNLSVPQSIAVVPKEETDL